VNVGIEVPNHIKFLVCFYLFFCSYLWVCFRLKRLLFLVRDFPTVVSEPGSDQGFLIRGGRGVIWHTDQNQRPLKRSAKCSQIYGVGCKWCSIGLMSECESRFATCAWRKCYTAYRSALVVASCGL